MPSGARLSALQRVDHLEPNARSGNLRHRGPFSRVDPEGDVVLNPTKLSTTKRPPRRRLRIATLALLASASLALSSAPVRASSSPETSPADSRGVYLALGDSIAFGYRPPEVTPPAAYGDPRNFTSYANYTAKATGLQLVNASCPGETTRTMMSLTAPDFRCRLYRSFAPLHTAYAGTQLHYALQFLRTHPNTRLITVSIGANDVFQCQETPGCHVPVAVARAAANLSTILKRLRTEAHYQGTIVTLTYHYTPDFPISVVKPLNGPLAAATRRHGGEVANGLAAFRTASRRHGGDPCDARLLIALPSGGCDRHPNAAGHLVLAVPVTLAYLQSREAAARNAAQPGSTASPLVGSVP